ncbi:MAG: hypothetical protein KC613_07625 [Myxococcales bacterium]|nr:hypothetical protein [Myxococcales bacterium]
MLADLHRHLDGSLRPATLAELAAAHGVDLPPDIRFTPGMGLGDALARFRITLACLQTPEAVARVADEICQDAAADGVGTLEIRFAPQLHGGASMAGIVDAALEGAAGRAGIILCVLYGDAPELAEALVDLARPRRGVVGLDLAGGPSPSHAFGMLDYAEAFATARTVGLGRTVHAGEGRRPAEIRLAIDRLHAQRIGHGVSLLEDPALTEQVARQEVVIEACPTSNVHTGVIPRLGAHPLKRWLAAGVRACVCTDNTLLSDVTASQELGRISKALALSAAEHDAVLAHGHAGAFRR